MESRFDPLAASCDHRALFALAYLRTTEEYERAAAEPGFFRDPALVNVEDVFFAAYYFKAYDDWAAGRTAAVPAAWRIAFTAAENRSVSGLGDLLLGMNAHITRDLPYVLVGLGLVGPDGQSRHADHLKVNVFLDRVIAPLLDEAAARFDPTINNVESPYGITYDAFMALIATWREIAWTNAVLLAAANTPLLRTVAQNTIELTSATLATTVRATFLYTPRLADTRDQYCATHNA
ncbi:MAG: hypothetical protein IRZ08_18245 [Frankia sp.]|nr:hypothetical protein [Frankia sp.]